METLAIKQSIHLFGNHVKDFLKGIPSEFDKLMRQIPEGSKRTYYGLSWMENGEIQYYVLAPELHDGEGKELGLHQFTIEAGDYLTVTIVDWKKKLATIKDVFETILKDSSADLRTPCIEWYKTDDEMLCMIKKI